MAKIAFLKILEHEGIIPDSEEVRSYLLNNDDDLHFDEVRPYEDYTPNGHSHRFVVWRYHRDDKVSDEEILNLVGEEGNVFYLWRCPRCKHVVRRIEFPLRPLNNLYFGCECPGTVFWGMAVF